MKMIAQSQTLVQQHAEYNLHVFIYRVIEKDGRDLKPL